MNRAMNPHRLSKSRYISGMQCHRRLWYDTHARGLAAPVDDSLQAVFDTGHEVGEIARERFPGGHLVAHDHLHIPDALEETRRVVQADAAPVLFEAAFEHERMLVRADVLERLPGGGWRLVEVKSTTRLKEVFILDVAVQLRVLRGAGIDVHEAGVLTLNREYIYDGVRLDLDALFKLYPVLDEASALLEAIGPQVQEMHEMLAHAAAPDIAPSSHCFTPYACQYYENCTRNLPTPEHGIDELPRLTEERRSQREVDKRNPGRPSRRNVEPRHDQQPARPRGGDIPESDALPIELGLLVLERHLVARRRHSEHGEVQTPGLTVDDCLLRRPQPAHGVDRHHDRPFQSLRRVHGVGRHRLLLGIGPPFDGTRLVRPGGGHRIGEGTQTPHRIRAAEAQVQVDVGERPFGLSAMALEKDRPHPEHVDRLRQQVVRCRRVGPASQRLELLDDVARKRMGDGFRLAVALFLGGGLALLVGHRNVQRCHRRALDPIGLERIQCREPGLIVPDGERALEAFIDEVEDRRTGPEIGRDFEDASRILLAERLSRPDVGGNIGATEPIDRLLRIADQKQCAGANAKRPPVGIGGGALRLAAEPPEDLGLYRIGILELLDEDVGEPSADQECRMPQTVNAFQRYQAAGSVIPQAWVSH